MILMILFIFRVQCSGFLFRVIVIAINTLVLFGNMNSSYNFTVYSLSDGKGTCFLWNETEGQRGSCEIATCLHLYLNSLSPCTEQVTLFSDFRVQCSGFLFHVIVIAINTLVLFGNMKRKIVFITENLSVFMVLNCSFSFLLTFLHIQGNRLLTVPSRTREVKELIIIKHLKFIERIHAHIDSFPAMESHYALLLKNMRTYKVSLSII
jgi:hypothetical protein